MQTAIGPSLVGLAIQLTGVFLITILSCMLLRSAPRMALEYWTAAWSCLTGALGALLASFLFPSLSGVLQPLYLFGEYVFGLLFVAGCQQHVSGSVQKRKYAWCFVGAAVLALILPPLGRWDLDHFFIPHAGVMAALFFLGFLTLHRARKGAGQGAAVLRIALLLLALDFIHYVPVFTLAAIEAMALPLVYLHYTSLYDLILQIMLGFGTVMLVTESVRQELEAANREATEARDKLEVLVRMDPLTESLNRHAFYSLLEKHRDMTETAIEGCAVMIDVDHLKGINDTFGHPAGDAAIRAVANAVRAQIRADDLLFRWGGDEFLVLLFGVGRTEARARMVRVNETLRHTYLPSAAKPVPVSVSYGLVAFDGTTPLDLVIERADAEMYSVKQSSRQPVAMGE